MYVKEEKKYKTTGGLDGKPFCLELQRGQVIKMKKEVEELGKSMRDSVLKK